MNMMAMAIGHNGGPSIHNDPRIEMIQRTALRRDLSAAEKMVYIGLLTAHSVNNVVQASTTTLKDYASATDRKIVYAATRALEKLGLIRKTKVAGRANTYSALPPNVISAVADAYHASKLVPKNGTTPAEPVPDNGTTTSAEKRHQCRKTAPLPVPPDGTTLAETSAVQRHLSEIEKKKGLPHTPSKEKLPLKITNIECVLDNRHTHQKVDNWNFLNPDHAQASKECWWTKDDRLEVAGDLRKEMLVQLKGDEEALRLILDKLPQFIQTRLTGSDLRKRIRGCFAREMEYRREKGKVGQVGSGAQTIEQRAKAVLATAHGKQSVRELGYEKALAQEIATLKARGIQ